VIYRREFLQRSALFGASLFAPRIHGPTATSSEARRIINPNRLEQFVDPLPLLTVARPSGVQAASDNAGVTLTRFEIPMREFESPLHRDLPPTRQWGYAGTVPGPIIETRSGQGLLVEWVNSLPQHHFLPVDHGLHGAESNLPEVRTVVHVHGAKAPPASDGYPENWFAPGKSALCHYPNEQDAAMLWYHDHAMGINRLNIMAGLFGVFIVRDATEDRLDLPKGKYEIPLVIYDRTVMIDGELFYPVSTDPKAPWVPEFYGNTTLVNGKIFPFLEVEPRMYRFRILNAANTRFFKLALSGNRPFHQIGTDSGLLPEPVKSTQLTLFPAERADLLIDFSELQNERIELINQASPLMQFRVGGSTSTSPSRLPSRLRSVTRLLESEAVKTRFLTLSEEDDPAGNSRIMLLNGTHWSMPVTEQPVLNSIEIWNLINLSEDAHPIHLHLVRFQILDRRPFDEFAYNSDKTLKYTGPAIAPEPGESGWKDTVRADPGIVTRIIARFEGYTGRYVWHCHLLEHEDNEMMRPYEVVASTAKP
jgi:spore coat protein A